MSWVKTATGRHVDFLNPDPNQITLSDIAIALSRVARFGGHSPLKVGQHICEVATLMMMKVRQQGGTAVQEAEAGIVGLVHDFPEYVIGDCPTPLKDLLGDLYHPIEARMLAAVVERFSLQGLMEKYALLLKWADRQAVGEEALRFELDGKYLSEISGEMEDRPFEWVDPTMARFLSDEVWEDEEDRQYSVICAFLRLMIQAGRGLALTSENTGIAGTSEETVQDAISELIPMPALLLNGDQYF